MALAPSRPQHGRRAGVLRPRARHGGAHCSLESPLDEVDNTPQECTMYRHGTVTARNSCCYPPDPEQGVIYSAPAGVADLSKLTPPFHVEAP